jgi:hypothetical protein
MELKQKLLTVGAFGNSSAVTSGFAFTVIISDKMTVKMKARSLITSSEVRPVMEFCCNTHYWMFVIIPTPLKRLSAARSRLNPEELTMQLHTKQLNAIMGHFSQHDNISKGWAHVILTSACPSSKWTPSEKGLTTKILQTFCNTATKSADSKTNFAHMQNYLSVLKYFQAWRQLQRPLQEVRSE